MIRPATMFSSVVMSLFALSVMVGCGGGEEETTGPMKPTTSDSDAKTADADSKETETEDSEEKTATASGIGSVSGTIKVTGEIPDLPPLVKQGDETAKDAEVCAAEAVPNQKIVVGEGNGLANVFVYLRKAPEGAPEMEPPKEPVLFDQKGCTFIPHAMVLQTSQPVKAVSSDAVPHNIHTYPIKNTALNQIIQPNDQSGLMIEYTEAEILPLKVGCDIHAWMEAWQLPLDHPYAAVTDANGNFKIENLPAGTHEFRIWHEQAGYLDTGFEVTIKDGEDTPVSLEYPIDQVNKE